MGATELGHVVLYVGDADASRGFYGDVLGWPIVAIVDLCGARAVTVTIVGSADHTITRSLYVLDPDGNEVELYIDTPGVDWAAEADLIVAPIRPLHL